MTSDLKVLAAEVERHRRMASIFAAGATKDRWTASANALQRILDKLRGN